VYRGLRQAAIEAVGSGAIGPSAAHPRVGGTLVDVPSGGGFATVVVLADGTTSLYTSVGGGTIGAGAHEPVAAATRRLLDVVDSQLALFARADDGALPEAGSVRFHVLGFTGSLAADVSEDCFWGRAEHALTPTIAATQEVITAIRAAGG
jgi:hypothetical protein